MELSISITIKAPVAKVWDALTKPELIKQYLFGTDTVTDWKVGSPITFSGEWEGKPYQDKGTVLAFEKTRFIKYNYFSAFSGKKDEPANYSIITYTLTARNGHTIFELTQDNIDDAKAKEHSENNWRMVFDTMKKMLEEAPAHSRAR